MDRFIKLENIERYRRLWREAKDEAQDYLLMEDAAELTRWPRSSRGSSTKRSRERSSTALPIYGRPMRFLAQTRAHSRTSPTRTGPVPGPRRQQMAPRDASPLL